MAKLYRGFALGFVVALSFYGRDAASQAAVRPTDELIAVHATIARNVAPDCPYSASVHGTVRRIVRPTDAEEPVHYRPDLVVEARLSCASHAAYTARVHVDRAVHAPVELTELIRAGGRITIGEPEGTCSYTPLFGFDGRALRVARVDRRCELGHEPIEPAD